MATCLHYWYVFSTSLGTMELMLECRNCGAFGTVASPTKEEWSKAFDAPSRAYYWADNSRVTMRQGVIWQRDDATH